MNIHNMSFQYIKENHPNFSAAMNFSSKGLKNKFETARVNESSGFEPLKFYCSGPVLKERKNLLQVELCQNIHTCDISRFRRELPIWSLSSRSHARETKPPDERFFQCHFSRTLFQSEHFIVYGSIYLANKLFTAQ